MKRYSRVFFLLIVLIVGCQLTLAKDSGFLRKPFFAQRVLLTYHTAGDEDYGYEYREQVRYKEISALYIKQTGPSYSYDLYVNAENMEPLYLSLTDHSGEMDAKRVEVEFSQEEIKMRLGAEERIKKKVFRKKEGELIYPAEQFAVLLRNLDFSRAQTTFKGLIYEYPYISTLLFAVEGKERVSVKAGDFDTYKIMLTLPGLKSIFFKAYFWVSTEEPHYLIKYEGKRHKRTVVTELVKIGELDRQPNIAEIESSFSCVLAGYLTLT
ncbi:DUF3108 domain-containing protein [Capillibacterium thermochitinicola]|uniref:DUF3108 domain-containing protein n=1 Tax=Capillibacterium thermochitinicola TaxID=2699427 RepID=A0A8J6I0Z6_9FIRM|nr:hypothetical protein [Capillibacterium thermochitinicola]MBA2133650.1 hypothetical protein [Capillibacterium thermochitinicola]